MLQHLKLVDEESSIYGLQIEQTVIAHCVWKPDSLHALRAKVGAEDFRHPLHQRVVAHMLALHAEGRHPSLMALKELVGDDEVEPGLTAEDYLAAIAKRSVSDLLMPFDDALETLQEQILRRQLSNIGSDIAAKATANVWTSQEIGLEAHARVDDVLNRARRRRKRSFLASDTGALAHELIHGHRTPDPTTGLADLDRMVGGWPRGQLSVVAGRPGAGKSAFATMSLRQAALAGHGCLFFSLEMTMQQLLARMLCDLAYTRDQPIEYQTVIESKLDDDRLLHRLERAHERFESLPLQIEEERGINLHDISARTRKAVDAFERRGQKLEVIFVDHMLLLQPSGRYKGNRVREVAEISDALATIASDLDIAVVALCQLNRGVEGRDSKVPRLADLRDSGAIEEDASLVLFLHRRAYYLAQQRHNDPELETERLEMLEACKLELDLSVAKNRNGRTGSLVAYCDIGANAIRDKAFGGW